MTLKNYFAHLKMKFAIDDAKHFENFDAEPIKYF